MNYKLLYTLCEKKHQRLLDAVNRVVAAMDSVNVGKIIHSNPVVAGYNVPEYKANWINDLKVAVNDGEPTDAMGITMSTYMKRMNIFADKALAILAKHPDSFKHLRVGDSTVEGCLDKLDDMLGVLEILFDKE